jgi:hypothetical protein
MPRKIASGIELNQRDSFVAMCKPVDLCQIRVAQFCVVMALNIGFRN